MSDNMLPLFGAGVTFVMLLHPVGLQHHPVARLDEILGQVQRQQGLQHQCVQSRRVPVVIGTAKGTHELWRVPSHTSDVQVKPLVTQSQAQL